MYHLVARPKFSTWIMVFQMSKIAGWTYACSFQTDARILLFTFQNVVYNLMLRPISNRNCVLLNLKQCWHISTYQWHILPCNLNINKSMRRSFWYACKQICLYVCVTTISELMSSDSSLPHQKKLRVQDNCGETSRHSKTIWVRDRLEFENMKRKGMLFVDVV